MTVRDRDSMALVRTTGAVWGIGGILLLLAWAIYRLAPYASALFDTPLTYGHWSIVALWSLFMIVTEGYDGFQKRLAPRIVERAVAIRKEGDVIAIILAPLYCFGYFRAPRQQMAISYVAVLLIVGAVTIVHQLPQPWRGIIDWGVIAGLGYGCGAILQRSYAHLRSIMLYKI